jgi:hypothetical protein
LCLPAAVCKLIALASKFTSKMKAVCSSKT